MKFFITSDTAFYHYNPHDIFTTAYINGKMIKLYLTTIRLMTSGTNDVGLPWSL